MAQRPNPLHSAILHLQCTPPATLTWKWGPLVIGAWFCQGLPSIIQVAQFSKAAACGRFVHQGHGADLSTTRSTRAFVG